LMTALLILALPSASLRAELQFSGYFLSADESVFTFRDSESKEASGWVRIGESFRSYTVRSFDREHEAVTVEKDGHLSLLQLQAPRVKDGRMTITGTITSWPGQSARSARASFVLGEDAAFPLGGGVTLHLTAERMADGSILYHARLVTAGGDGREKSDTWPDVVSPPGGEFSIRNETVGFSFKP